MENHKPFKRVEFKVEFEGYLAFKNYCARRSITMNEMLNKLVTKELNDNTDARPNR